MSLVETEPVEGGRYVGGFGLLTFIPGADVPDVPSADGPDKALPTTGNASIVLLPSAAAAAFSLVRRRKAAADWE